MIRTKFSPFGAGGAIIDTLAGIIKNHPNVVNGEPDYHNVETGWHIYKFSTGLTGLIDSKGNTYGDTYCYRGAGDNYLMFGRETGWGGGNLIWQIMRVNEDGSVKLILNNFNASLVFYFASIIYTSGTAITTLTDWWDSTNLDTYYDESANNFVKKIIVDVPFYWDRELSSISQSGYKKTFANIRTTTNDSNLNPILYDPGWETKGYGFSVAKGNLSVPCGFLLPDEVIIAGAVPGTATYNTAFSTTGAGRTACCPHRGNNTGAGYIQWFNSSNGSWGSNLANSGNKYSVRPVINISGDIRVSGSGTLLDPYRLKE